MENKMIIEKGRGVTVAREENRYIVLFDYREDEYRSPEKRIITINWSALGSVSIEEAEKFYKSLGRMIRFAKRLGKKIK